MLLFGVLSSLCVEHLVAADACTWKLVARNVHFPAIVSARRSQQEMLPSAMLYRCAGLFSHLLSLSLVLNSYLVLT
jgi:hypothetical protein